MIECGSVICKKDIFSTGDIQLPSKNRLICVAISPEGCYYAFMDLEGHISEVGIEDLREEVTVVKDGIKRKIPSYSVLKGGKEDFKEKVNSFLLEETKYKGWKNIQMIMEEPYKIGKLYESGDWRIRILSRDKGNYNVEDTQGVKISLTEEDMDALDLEEVEG